MLKRLEIANFKAWREVDLAFGKVTGFFGTNSAGKSSLLQFLLLLKQTRDATDRGLVLDFGEPGSLANLGTFADIVHGQNRRTKIYWRLDWKLPKPLKIQEDPMDPKSKTLFKGDSLSTECEVGWNQKRPWTYLLGYQFDGISFWLQSLSKSKNNNFELGTTPDKEFEFIRNRGRSWPLPHPVKTYLFPSQARNYYQNSDFLGDFELAYEKLMDSFYYLGPLREPPKRDYHWSGSSPNDVGQRGERAVDAILAATRDEETRTLRPPARGVPRIEFQEIIAHWLRELKLISEFDLDEIAKGTNLYRAMVRTSLSNVWTALTDVGFGVSQVLPALVLLYYVPEGSTVLMEQPEIHLHPDVQSGLADVILNVAAVRDVQIIVESHSEHLLRRLQRRVAEEKASSEDVKLYFVSSQKGQARVSDLILNEWGEIENWPDSFFGDEMGEIAAIVEAGLKRKMEQSR